MFCCSFDLQSLTDNNTDHPFILLLVICTFGEMSEKKSLFIVFEEKKERTRVLVPYLSSASLMLGQPDMFLLT